ncbi:MAG: xanthine dehydrogenase iron-sulfur cluster and FAD-binding subunit A, partial [Alphaproteobacteria bacterium]
MIRFTLNGTPHEVGEISPTTTMLDYVRENLHMTGTKEGCA